MSSILNDIEKIGIRVTFPRSQGSLQYDGQFYDLPSNSQVVFLETVFAGNTGFIKVESGNFKAVLLKGIYKDYITIMEGTPNINPTMMSKLSETASSTEKEVGAPVRLGVFTCDDNTRFVFSVEKLPIPDTDLYERRMTFFKGCFSPTEYSLYQNSNAADNTLYGRGALSSFFPETVSPLAESFIKELSELFNPLPMSVNIKTMSPSVSAICGKVFTNTSSMNPICETTGTSDSYYLLNYAPWLYLKSDKHSFKVPNLKIFAIDEKEIRENLAELKETSAKAVTEEMVFSGGLVEVFALFAMTAQLVQLKTWEAATTLYGSLKDFETVLKFVFLTREKSLLDEKLEMMPYIDPLYAPICSKVSKPFISTSFNELFAALPLSKRMFLSKDKLRAQVAELHKYLEMKDSYTKSLFTFSGEIRKLFMSTGERMVESKLFNSAEDIFVFDMSDISRFLKDQFFGNVPLTLFNKKMRKERSLAQLVSYDIFERDIDKIPDIAERISKNPAEEIPCLAFFHKNHTGQGNAPRRLNDQLSDIALVTNFSPALLPSLDKCKAIVTDTAPLFSYLTEYCTRTNTPLYAGVRFAGLFYNGHRINLTKNSIKIMD